MRSLHIIGSRELGGAESFYSRFVPALSNFEGQEVVAVTRPGAMVAQTLPSDLTCQGVPMRSGWDLASVVSIRRLIHRLRPDIVQTYMGRATRLTRIPRSASAVHVARLGGFYKIDGYYRHADAWVGNSKALCDYLIREGLPAQRVYRIGNFVEPPAPTPASLIGALRKQYQIPADAIVLFSLGRLIPKKGFSDLLEAFAALPTHIGGRPLFLVIAGDGPLCTKLASQTAALSIEHRTRWLGWQMQTTPIFHLADIFICPSRDEPLGNVILEAWAHRLPVVSTDTVGARELIQAEDNGLVVATGRPDELAGCLRSLLTAGPTAWHRLAERGAHTVRAHHSRAAVVGCYVAMYEGLVRR